MSEILRSWKEISSYAGASVRTLQRWEREFHLPIRRIATKKGSVVFAFRSDLDAWFRARTQTAEMMVRDEHFRMVFINAPLPSMVVDNSRKVLDVNEAACKLLGVDRIQLMGRAANMVSENTAQYDDEEWNNFLREGASLGQRNVRRGDGTVVGIEYVMKSVYPGLNMITVVATHPGGVPRDKVYYHMGRGRLSL